MGSLEEKVCVFMDDIEHYNNFNESELMHGGSIMQEDLWLSETSSDSDEPPQRTLYWESQEVLLQVNSLYIYIYIYNTTLYMDEFVWFVV